MNETLGDESLRAAYEVSGIEIEKIEQEIPNSKSYWLLPVRVSEVSETQEIGDDYAS